MRVELKATEVAKNQDNPDERLSKVFKERLEKSTVVVFDSSCLDKSKTEREFARKEEIQLIVAICHYEKYEIRFICESFMKTRFTVVGRVE